MRRYRNVIIAGLLIAVIIAGASAWLASGSPDGLNRVAEDQGFSQQEKSAGYEILPGYTIPGVSGELSTVLAGAIGVVIVGGLAFGAGYLMRRRNASSPGAEH